MHLSSRIVVGALSLAAALLVVAAMRGDPPVGAIRRDVAPLPLPDPAWVRELGPSNPGSPLPDDPALAAWTLAAERAFYPALRLAELAQDSPPTGPNMERAGKARAAWELVERSGLPASDVLRVKAARHYIEAVAHEQPLEAARTAERRGMLPMAMMLYRQGQSPEDDERIHKMRQQREREPRSPEPKGKPPSSPAEHLHQFTHSASAEDEPCTPTATEFLRRLPDNARLRRVAMLAFNPCSDCGFQDTTGESDGNVPLLRLTAQAAPEEFVRTFAALRHVRLVVSRRGRLDPRDSALAGDSLRVAQELLPQLPPSTREELARELARP